MLNKSRVKQGIVFKEKTQRSATFALGCTVVMLGIFLWVQLVYNLDMLFAIIPLNIVGICIYLFCMVPHEYVFSNTCLEIQHKFFKPLRIPYELIYDYELNIKDNFLNITADDGIKVYYEVGKKYKFVSCYPENSLAFAEELKRKIVVDDEEILADTKLEKLLRKE